MKHPNAHELVKAYEHFGQDIPPGLNPPDLHDVEWAYWRAFRELSTERQAGMAAGPIPWSKIQEYADRNPGIDLGVFPLVMREMDDVYLAHESEANKKAEN